MNSLVTGATGFVGENLVKKLLERGDKVRCFARTANRSVSLKNMGVDLAEGDVKDYDSVLEATRGMDHVYHCAAAMGIGAMPRAEYFAINEGGCKNVVKACEKEGVDRLVYVSSQSVTFDFSPRVNATEDNPSFPSRYKDPYSESKARGEREVIEAGRDGRLQACAIRPTFIWGRGDRLMLPAMAKMAKQNQLALIGGGKSKLSPSHVDNVCDIIMLASDKEGISGEAFLVTDDEDITAGEFTRRLTQAAGLPEPKKSIPYSIAYSVSAVVEKVHELPFIKKPPSMTRYGAAIMGIDLTFSCEKAKKVLGYKPSISLDEGMRQLSDWIKEMGGIEELIS